MLSELRALLLCPVKEPSAGHVPSTSAEDSHCPQLRNHTFIPALSGRDIRVLIRFSYLCLHSVSQASRLSKQKGTGSTSRRETNQWKHWRIIGLLSTTRITRNHTFPILPARHIRVKHVSCPAWQYIYRHPRHHRSLSFCLPCWSALLALLAS